MESGPPRKKLFIGTVDALCDDDELSESSASKSSDLSVEIFNNGDDDEDFNTTIEILDRNIASSNAAVEEFNNGEEIDETFNKLISKTIKQCYNVSAVRQQCRKQAEKFKFDLTLFDRMPMWVFRALCAQDPMCKNSLELTKIDIMGIFMLINNVSPELMMAMYIEGGQSIEDGMQLLAFFKTIKKLYDKTAKDDLLGLFGNAFTYHCQSRTLRQIDMTKIDFGTKIGRNEPFIPDTITWRRERIVRNLIRNGKFTVDDDLSLYEVKRAWQNGQRLIGRYNKK